MFRLLTILAVAASVGFADRTVAGTISATDTTDSAIIYGAFLDYWTGKEKKPINISVKAEAPTAEALKQFSDCAGDTHWAPVESIYDLTGLIGKLSYVRLVDPDMWSPRDPGELIAQGRSVESGVESGFDSSLVTFSAIAFDETHTTAAFTFSFVCGSRCGTGRTVVFKRTADGWGESAKQCDVWVSQASEGMPNYSFKPTPLRGAA